MLKCLHDNGLTLNKEKCVFGKKRVKYLGYIISADGILPDPGKIDSIKSLEPPNNVHEVRSFLGMINFMARFVPNLANETKPLRDLVKKKQNWKWGAREDKCFKKVKGLVEQAVLNSYFDVTRPCHLYVDAGPHGLGAVLVQPHSHINKVVACASCSLTPVQKRYSQIERELLAVTWAVERYKMFIQGADFVVKTDHRPLISLLAKHKPTSARLERLKFKLLGYNLDLQYIPGKLNPSDYMSRHPVKETDVSDIEEFVNHVAELVLPTTITRGKLREATKQDIVLQDVIAALLTDSWDNPAVA